MKEPLIGKLDEGEDLLWVRLPRGSGWRGGLLAVQIVGHILLTATSVVFALSVPVRGALQILLGGILFVCTNAPLVGWAFYRWPQIHPRGDAVLFVTDRRVGSLRSSGEMRQAPVSPSLEVVNRAGVVEFRLEDQTRVSFGSLTPDEAALVETLVDGLTKKAE